MSHWMPFQNLTAIDWAAILVPVGLATFGGIIAVKPINEKHPRVHIHRSFAVAAFILIGLVGALLSAFQLGTIRRDDAQARSELMNQITGGAWLLLFASVRTK